MNTSSPVCNWRSSGARQLLGTYVGVRWRQCYLQRLLLSGVDLLAAEAPRTTTKPEPETLFSSNNIEYLDNFCMLFLFLFVVWRDVM